MALVDEDQAVGLALIERAVKRAVVERFLVAFVVYILRELVESAQGDVVDAVVQLRGGGADVADRISPRL